MSAFARKRMMLAAIPVSARLTESSTGGDDRELRRDRPLPSSVAEIEPEGSSALERSCGGNQLYVVARELVPGYVNLVPNDLIGAEEQVLDRNVLLDGVRDAVEGALAEARQIEYRLSKGLAGNRSGVDADPAKYRPALHQRHALVELGGLNGGTLAGRT